MKKILIIEDDVDIREMLIDYLSQDIQKLSLVLGIIFIILTGISIKKYADKIE